MNIQSMIENIKQQKDSLTSSYKLKDFFYNAACIFTFVAGARMLFFEPLVGISLIGMTGGIFSSKYNNFDNYKFNTQRLNKEKSYLESLTKTGVNISEQKKKERNHKIEVFKNKANHLTNELSTQRGMGTLINLGLIGVTIASIANPGILSFVVPAISLGKIVHDKNMTQTLEQQQQYLGNLNVVKNEQDVAAVVASRKQKMNKTNTQEKQQRPVQKSYSYTRNYDETNQKQNTNRPKVLVKR